MILAGVHNHFDSDYKQKNKRKNAVVRTDIADKQRAEKITYDWHNALHNAESSRNKEPASVVESHNHTVAD